MSKRYIVHMHVGFAGMDGYDVLTMSDDATEDEIDQEAHFMALAHAESYGYYPPHDGCYEESDEDDWNSDKVSDGIEGYAELYDPEKHDMHRSGGGSFEQDFEREE